MNRVPLEIGVTVLPEYFQSESVEGVLDRLQQAGVSAVTTSPYVLEIADAGSGAREPPIDAGAGQVRKLDRKLWGQHELWVRTAPSFAPTRELYQGLRYQPPEPDALTADQGSILESVFESAQRRGMRVSLQVQAAIPPGYRVQFGGPRDEDKPRMPDGSIPQRRVANNGSLASPEIIGYQHALLRDLCRRYPTADAIRVDWPEYPPYSLDDIFVDFSDPARAAADRFGFDFERMRADAEKLYELLHGRLAELPTRRCGRLGPLDAIEWSQRFPGVLELLRFKRRLAAELLGGFRGVIDEERRGTVKLAANLFPPPWSFLSGADYAQLAESCHEFAIKLYGMHWKMMLRFYGDQLVNRNPSVDRRRIVEGLLSVFDFMDPNSSSELSDYVYPGPDEAFGVSLAAQHDKIAAARHASAGAKVRPLAHSYGPANDFRQRLRAALEASPEGVLINRYGYLSDEKLAIVGECARELRGGEP